MLVIAIALIVMGILLYIVDKKSKSDTSYYHINFKQSMLIGISQALAAAFPGVSRSGITMTVARKLGIDRESAAIISGDMKPTGIYLRLSDETRGITR